MNIKRDKLNGVTVGYFIHSNGQDYYACQSSNKSWNLSEGNSPIKGFLDSFDTFAQLKESLLLLWNK